MHDSPEAALSSLLSLARQLVSLVNPADILAEVARRAQELCGSSRALAYAVAPGQPWERGTRVCTDGSFPIGAAARSALFALHRRMVATRSAVRALDDGGAEPLHRGLSSERLTVRSVLALPILNRRGNVVAAIVLTAEAPDAFADVPHMLLDELGKLAMSALENAHRLAVARRDQERLLLLAEATAEALWDWNLSTGELWWGLGVYNLLGSNVVAERQQPTTKHERIAPADQERIRDSLQAALASASSWREEYALVRADGSTVAVEDRAFFLRDAGGRAYRVIGALRDVSEVRELLLREQVARADAEAANRAKDEFLAMLGHELRNPLAPILTSLQLMKLRGDTEASLERDVIERQARHLVRLVDDLLDVSRITRGLIELQRELVEVADVMHMAIAMVDTLLQRRGHALHVQVPAEGLLVHVDPARLAQVVSNLLTNAARYTEPGGRVDVSATRVGDVVELSVRDTGIGIEPEMRERVFELFIQGRQGSDRSQGGLGLGLSIVKNLVSLHGGQVAVHSEGHGRGSVFTVRLPLAEREASTPPAPPVAQRPERTHRPRVLIVDDNQDAAELLALYLERVGYETQVTFDPRDALVLADEFQPEIAVLDIGLPVMDGYELARQLRERAGERVLKLVTVTGYGQPADRERSRAAGIDVHLIKPVMGEQLDLVLRGLTRTD